MEEGKKSGPKVRARGRPRKETANEPQEDKRERARRAQKNYQLRKQADNDSLKERVAFLEKAIENMGNEFIGLGDRIVTSRAQSKILLDLKSTTERFLDIARATQSQEITREDTADNETTESIFRAGSATPTPQTEHILRNYSEELPAAIPLATATSTYDPSFVPISQNSKWSPRIGYGLMGTLPGGWDPNPETIWKTYSVAGPNSFAMRIYSDSLMLLLMLIRGQVTMTGILPSLGRFRFRHEDPRLLVGHLEDHLSKVAEITLSTQEDQTGAVVLHGPLDASMSSALRRAIFKDVSVELGTIEGWLDPFHTQEYLAGRWQIQLTSDSAQVSTQTLRSLNIPVPDVAILQNTELYYPSQPQSLWRDQDMLQWGIQSFLEPRSQEFNLVINAQPLSQALVSESICFGEGPRFFKGNIDKAVIAFLSGISSSSEVLAIPLY